jgi:hypothetical protein
MLCNITEKKSAIFSDILSWTNYWYRLSIFWKPQIIFRLGDNLQIIFYFDKHPYDVNCNSYIQTKLWAMSSRPIKFKCDSKQNKTDNIRSKLSDIFLRKQSDPRRNITIIEIFDHSNIGSDDQYLKLIIWLTILIIDYCTAILWTPIESTNYHIWLAEY